MKQLKTKKQKIIIKLIKSKKQKIIKLIKSKKQKMISKEKVTA